MRRGTVGFALLACIAVLSLSACGRRDTVPAGGTQAAGAKLIPHGKPAAAASPAVHGEQAAGGTTVTYTNARYGFTLRIPARLKPRPFDGPWSVMSFTGEGGREGTPVVSVPVFEVNHGGVATGQPYPLFFYAKVRIGVSTNTADCFQAPPSGIRGERAHDELIGGLTFRAIPVNDAGMMKYLKAVSYRVVHDGRCFAVDQIARGSSYRDSSMKPGLSQAQLDAYYHEASEIAHSFRFLSSPSTPR